MSLSEFALATVLLSAYLVTGVLGECPERYERFSTEHTYCLPDNTSCRIIARGVTPQVQEYILKHHNDYRNYVALGKDPIMPKAASMLQLLWDNELAAIAQKHAESCRLHHDCEFCRMTTAFPVGQTIAYQFTESWKTTKPSTYSWGTFMNFILKQKKNFDPSQIDSFKPPSKEEEKPYDFFSQLLWDKTYYVGCGFAQFMAPGKIYNYYVCNYGPKGNIEGLNVYQKGEACSKCPPNTRCSANMEENPAPYEGLCKIFDPLKEPDLDYFRETRPTETFYCTFHDEPDCKYSVTGASRFSEHRMKNSYVLEVLVSGGESATIDFTNPIKSPNGGLSLKILLRRMPLKAGQRFAGELSIRFIAKLESTDQTYFLDNPNGPEEWSLFHEEQIGHILQPQSEVKFSLTLKVPEGAPPQVLELKRVIGGSSFDTDFGK